MSPPSPTAASDPSNAAEVARFDRFRPRTRSSRRRVVVVFGVTLVLTAVAGSLPDTPALGLAGSSLTLLGIVAGLGLGAVLRWSVHSTADLPDEDLDERLIAERDAAYLVAYPLIAGILLFTVAGIDIAVPLLERSATAEAADIARVTGAVLPAIVPLTFFAPSAVLAWRRTEV